MALICSGEAPVSSMAVRKVLVVAHALRGPVARDVEEGGGDYAWASGQHQARSLSFSVDGDLSLELLLRGAGGGQLIIIIPEVRDVSRSCSAASALLSFLRARTWSSRSPIVLANSLISASV